MQQEKKAKNPFGSRLSNQSATKLGLNVALGEEEQ